MVAIDNIYRIAIDKNLSIDWLHGNYMLWLKLFLEVITVHLITQS